jgi:hypothetical protein
VASNARYADMTFLLGAASADTGRPGADPI